MGKTRGATDTQKTLLIALYEGWVLRYAESAGWCLFQPGRERPFARVKARTVAAMTRAGWITAGMTSTRLGYMPRKDLTPDGLRYAERLSREAWADAYEWEPAPGPHQVDFRDPPEQRRAA
jgi:hypothetical protein